MVRKFIDSGPFPEQKYMPISERKIPAAEQAYRQIRGLLFTDLERGKDWYFQIQAIGPNGPSPWSDVALMMVV